LGGLGFDAQGRFNSYAYATDRLGTVVGNANKYGEDRADLGTRPVRWDVGSTVPVELESSGTSPSGLSFGTAVAISASGAIAGQVTKYLPDGTDVGYRAVRWAPGGTAVTELGHIGTDPAGFTHNYANAINSAGTVVGYGRKHGGSGQMLGFRPIRWDAGSTVATELGHLGLDPSGVTTGRAYDINETGVAVGEIERYDSGVFVGTRAVRWDPGGVDAIELQHLGTDSSGSARAVAYAINNAGTIAGESRKYGPSGQDLGNRAVKWVGGGPAVTELQQLEFNVAGAANSYVNDINRVEFIVGSALRYSEPNPMLRSRAVLWYPDGHIVDLNSLVPPEAGWWILLRACAISDTGWITGIGWFDPDGPAGPIARYQRLFLTQIPEPATLVLLGLAAAIVRRRG